METANKKRDLRIVVIGAGMSGILSGIKLREAGFNNVVLYEKAERIGGTWRENTYPGLSCDVPSHSYTYSFEPNPDWSRQMPPGAEIQAYFERAVKKYALDDILRCNEEVIRCEFIDGRWRLTMKSGLTDVADFVIAATGVLHHPSYPSIEGLDRFDGASFHSARWDHSVPLDGRRIGVIGNGSTGVQIVAALAGRAAKLKQFQRTAQWILPVENAAFTPEQRQAFRDDPVLLKKMQADPAYLVVVDHFTKAIVNADSPEMAQIEAVVRDNLERGIADPVLREKLRPNYRAACKRMILSPDYYQAIQHPNAELVNTGIEAVEARGVRTRDGVLHELDVLVLATGFKVDQFMRPMNVVGRDGVALNDVWAKRPHAYLAMSVPAFPNFFMLNGPTGPVGNFSLIDVAEAQWAYISQILEKIDAGEFREASVSQSAMNDFEQARIAAAKNTIWASGCMSWYLDAEGVPSTWPWSYGHFREVMKMPDLAHFDLVR